MSNTNTQTEEILKLMEQGTITCDMTTGSTNISNMLARPNTPGIVKRQFLSPMNYQQNYNGVKNAIYKWTTEVTKESINYMLNDNRFPDEVKTILKTLPVTNNS